MDKITKKEFLNLHKNDKIELIGSFWKHNKRDVKKALENYEGILEPIKTTRVDVANSRSLINNVYTDKEFIYLEQLNDASKDENCSWDDVTVNTILYKRKM